MPKKTVANSGKRGRFTAGFDPRRGRGPVAGSVNAGRPPSALRDALRRAAFERVDFLTAVADGFVIEASVSDRLRATELLLKYGLGAPQSADGAPTRVAVVVVRDGESGALPGPGRLAICAAQMEDALE